MFLVLLRLMLKGYLGWETIYLPPKAGLRFTAFEVIQYSF